MGKTASNQAVQNFEPKYGRVIKNRFPVPYASSCPSIISFSVFRDRVYSLVLSGRSSLFFCDYEPQF